MMRTLLASLVVLSVLASIPAYAQTDLGSLRGYVKDEQGGVLPGVTVTATGPQILAPVVAVTDDAGYYRLLNLPPGTVTVMADLPGFAPYRREGILMRAASTFTMDIELNVGTLAETVTVKGVASPMIETSQAGTSFVISGELLRVTQMTSRGIFTDSIDLIPGVQSRPAAGSGVRVYYSMGAGEMTNYTALDGASFMGFSNSAAPRTTMSTETVGDTELRTGGHEASTPLVTGVYMNIIAPQGGNTFKGSVGFALQPMAWNADNSSGGRVSGGLPKPEGVRQLDLSLGGPIVRDKAWFFSTFRWTSDIISISRTSLDLSRLLAFKPDFQPFGNTWKTKNPFLKVTTQIKRNHVLSATYIYDRSQYTSDLNYDADQIAYQSGGGSMGHVNLNSTWGQHLTSRLSVDGNNKTTYNVDTYRQLAQTGTSPQVQVNNDIFMSSGLPVGTGLLALMNNPLSRPVMPSSVVDLQGDVTYIKEGWIGSHEFKAGVWAAPRSYFDITEHYVNDGFVLEEMRQIDPKNAAAGITPFHMQYITPISVQTTAIRDKDIAVYFQDSWKPTDRITISPGLRVDWIDRYDAIKGVQRMKSVNVGPRFGVSYLLTKDAKNVLHFFAGRTHEMMSGNDVLESFTTAAAVSTRDVYIDKSGNQTTIITPPPTAAQSALQFARNLSQPFVDEFSVGFRKQFPGQISLDVSGRRRTYKNAYSLVDINGIYPSGPNQPFGGFGLVDPNRGIIYQERNDTWSQDVVTGLEMVVAKNMSHNLQGMVSMSRQWQYLAGTWNPTDPARFIQPGAFANNRNLPGTNGNTDANSLDGGASSNPTFMGWRPYAIRVAGQYLAPWGFTLSGSYNVTAGDYSSPIVTRLAQADPIFGPSRVTLANGTTQPNPLATVIRFAFPTRGEGQVLNEPLRVLALKFGREFRFGPNRLTATLSIYNLLNSGSNQQYGAGANQLYSPNYLAATNRLPARAFQLMIVNRF